MQFKKEEEFAKAVKGGQRFGLYLLYGMESYLVDAWRKKLTAAFEGGFGSFNLQRLDGRRLNCEELYDAVEALPLMASEKCVVVDDLEPGKLSPTDMDKLLAVMGDVPSGCTLLITGKPPAFDPKAAASKKIITLAGKTGAAVELGSRDAGGQTAFLKTLAKRAGCELGGSTARYILELCESDMHNLTNEMNKLCALADGGEITRAHVDAVVIPKTEARVFDLSKAILAGNSQRAMELLDSLFYLREAPIAILSVLILSYVDLYRARAAKDCGKGQNDMVEKLGYKGREFRVRNAFGAKLSTQALRRSLEALQQCDFQLKSTGSDDRVLLEQTVVKLIALRSV